MTLDIFNQTEPGLTIQEMAQQSELSEHTLRYYERIGLLTPIPRDGSSGHRRYPPEAVGLIESLACLRGTGMSLDNIRRYLQLREQGMVVAGEQKALFAAHKDALEDEMEQMQKRIEYLTGKVAYWEAVEAGDMVRAREIGEANQLLARSLIEPGGFTTDWGGSSSAHAEQMPVYDAIRQMRTARFANVKYGDPVATSAAILKVVDAENPPLRLFLGAYATQIVPQMYEQRLKTWVEWADVSRAADGG
jgi:DNA-binding transcriptional MerR regulator